MPPTILLAQPRKRMRKKVSTQMAGNMDKGKWSHRPIQDVKKWISRKHGEVNYYLTQFLSGHGGYRRYLHRFRLDNSPKYQSCTYKEETVEHIVCDYSRFAVHWRIIEEVIAMQTSSETIVDEIKADEEVWTVVSYMLCVMLWKYISSSKILKC